MTTSDLERSLAEARASAARRLQSLKREGHRQQAADSADSAIGARREPVENFSRVPPEQVVRIDPPPVAARRVAAVTTAPEPSIAYPLHPGAGQYAGGQVIGQQNAIEASYRPAPGAEYVPVDRISRIPDETSAPPLHYVETPDYTEHREYLAPGSEDIRRNPGLMTRLLGGVAAFRRSRAERRELVGAGSAPVRPRMQAMTAKEQRWERRRKRYLFEEILGWILVPVILVSIYFLAVWVLEVAGMSPDIFIEGIQTIWSQFR